jgi:hypothetical protein
VKKLNVKRLVVNMIYSKLKILFFAAVGFALLLAPLALEIAPDGNAYAGILFGGGGGRSGSGSSSPSGITISDSEPPTAHTPEPATMLLFGAGAAGLVAYKKYRKKK